MTGTKRASHPRALVHDRSLSRNNRDKSLPKGGSGGHNWGSIEDEAELRTGAEYYEELESGEGPQAQNNWTGDAEPAPVDKEVATQTNSQVMPGDIARTSEAARLRKPHDTVPIGSGADTAVDPTFERK